ncbi:helix-turn-helix domain-containing protein [Enterobacter roggenkampii]|uniref:helix-turn-helix domain-containing protein n=1 Tax=Enterobacter roggenkampii TaxID=1812935 RepID=UPI002A82B489|nr:helix-turn-helix domain-containing protein [Enterobacter roggenkampii]
MNSELTPLHNLENLILSLPSNRNVMVCGKEDISMTLRTHPTVFFLQEGRASLRLKSNGRIIADFKAPAILGIEMLLSPSPDTTVHVDGAARLLQVPAADLAREIERMGMWQDVFRIMAEHARQVRDNLTISAFGSSYEVIRHHLMALNSSTQESMKPESFHRYISERSTVSRSTLHKIIKSLQVGQYIDIKRGKLIELRHLPEKY